MPKKEIENGVDLLPEDVGSDQESKLEHEVDEIAEELDIHLPHVNLPLPIKLIALFTLVGGLSIVGSTFVDIFAPSGVGFLLYLWRIVAGAIALVIAYGLVEKQRWSVWLYGLLVLIALFANFLFALLPAVIVAYLYTQRRYFTPSIFDSIANNIFSRVRKKLRNIE